MVKEVLLFLRNFLFSFKGRVNRAKLWVFSAWLLLTTLIMDQMDIWYTPFEGNHGQSWSRTTLDYLLASAEAAFGGLVFYCFAAVAAKRLHDRNRSAWFLTVLCGAQLARFAVNGTAPGASFVAVITWIASAWILVELFLLPGTPGNNRFGPDPLPPIKEPSPEQLEPKI